MQKKISVELSPELHAQVKAALYGGIGAVNAYIDENGHLIIELKTGQTFDCGMAVGPKGDTGPQGERGPQGEKGEKGDTGPQGTPGIISELQDEDGTAMPPEPILQFVGFQVNDDPSGKTVVSPKTSGDTKNVAGYVGEISLFADNQLRENHVWADGSTINPATWPDLAAYAATAGWETDSGTGWYKTPNLQGCFLLPSSAEHAVNTTGGEKEHTHTYGVRYSEYYGALVDGIAAKDYPTGTFLGSKPQSTKGRGINSGLATQKSSTQSDQWLTEAQTSAEPTMPPYYVVTAQIRAKVDIIEATAVEVNGNTLSGFKDGQFLAQQSGKVVGVEAPRVAFAKATITAKNGFTINSRCFVISYGAIYVCNVDIKVPSNISTGWVDIFTTDLPACADVTVRLPLGRKDEAHAESRDFQFHGNRLEAYFESTDRGIVILGTIVSYRKP